MNDVRRGRLKLYLGAAPGVGKTCRMLDEARRRVARGADVVVGFAECHGRPRTEAMLDGLEVVARAQCAYRGGYFEEMDLLRRSAVAPHVSEPEARDRRESSETRCHRSGLCTGTSGSISTRPPNSSRSTRR